MNETKQVTLSDLGGTVAMLDVMLGRFRQGLARTMTPEKLAALEADPPNECPNCNAVIGDHDSFCSEECERQFNGADELISRPDFVLDEDEDGTPGERLARDGYCEVDEDRLRDQEQDR